MNCPQCGASLLQGALFCGGCGYKIQATTPQQPASTGQRPAPASHGINIDEDSTGQGGGYSYEVLHQPAFSLAVIRLQPEQSIQAEAGAMVSMSANIELQSQMKGGLFGPSNELRVVSRHSFRPSRPGVDPAK